MGKKIDTEEPKALYAVSRGVHYPIAAAVNRLDAGFYELGQLPGGLYGLQKSTVISDELIDIEGTPPDDVSKDIAKFLAQKERYTKAGLTHKRGYLFYGPPGTGKTSMGIMIARRFIREADGVVCFVPNDGYLEILTDVVRQVEPGRPTMFLMEEADSYLDNPTALSILDGEKSLAGAVFVAMTNYKERMPPRLANRPGRFDRVIYVGAPPYRVQVEYFRRLLTRLDEPGHEGVEVGLADCLKDISISMGHLREAFISHVLMDIPLDEVRLRFQKMAGIIAEEDPSIIHMDDEEDEPDDDDFDDE